MKTTLPRHLKYSIFGAIILSILMLLLYTYLGTFMRMIADDYCEVVRGLQYNPIEIISYSYNQWVGRYSTVFLYVSFTKIRPEIHPWMVLLTILAWIGVFYYIFYQLGAWLNFPQRKQISFILAILITFYWYRLVPADQHIFWLSAIIPHVWGLLISLFLFGNIIHYFSAYRSNPQQIIMPIYSGIIVFLLGGFSEVELTMLITFFALMLLATPFIPSARRREYIILVVVCLIVAIIAFLIVLSAPGPQMRRNADRDASHIPLSILLIEGGLYTFLYIFGEFFGITFGQTYALAYLSVMYSTLLFAGLFLMQKYPDWKLPAPRRLGLTALIVALISFILIASTVVPMYYAAVGLPLRALIHPRFVQLFTVMFWVYLSLAAFQRYDFLSKLEETRTWSIVLVFISFMIIWSPIASIGRYLSYIPNFQAYAQSWDERHEKLLNAEDDAYVIVEPLAYDIEDHLVLEKLIDDSTFWINSCTASYYGLEGIEVQEKEEVE